jgi:hypothetical protein
VYPKYSPAAITKPLRSLVGALVVGALVVGALVVGALVVGALVDGALVVGASVDTTYTVFVQPVANIKITPTRKPAFDRIRTTYNCFWLSRQNCMTGNSERQVLIKTLRKLR